MASLILKPVRNIETLARGYNYEGTVDIANDVPTAGAVPIKVKDADNAEAEVVGTIFKAALRVDELVPTAPVSGSNTFSSYKVTIGDTADADGMWDSQELLSSAANVLTAGKQYYFKGTNANDSVPVAVTNMDATFTSAGETDEALAGGGRITLFVNLVQSDGELAN